MVERNLAKVDVARSNRVTRLKYEFPLFIVKIYTIIIIKNDTSILLILNLQKLMSKDSNMSITEHFEELIQRILISAVAFITIFFIIFFNINNIVNLLQIPAQGIKFLVRCVYVSFYVIEY